MTVPEREPPITIRTLRQRAEAQLASGLRQHKPFAPQDVDSLLHELNVHHVELDLQNEQLRSTHEALEQARNRYFDLYEEAPVAYLSISGTGGLIACNRSAAELLQLNVESFARYRFFDLLAPVYHTQFSERQVALALTGAADSFDAIMRRADGTRFWATLRMSVARTDSGTDMVRVAVIDIDKQRRADSVIGRLSAIVTGSNQAILSHDLTGTITSWNAAAMRLLGYEEQELVGRNTHLLLPADRKGEDILNVSRVMRGEPVMCDTIRVGKDGHAVAVTVTVSPILNDSGVIVGVSQIMRSIADQVASRAALNSQVDNMRERQQVLVSADQRKDEVIATLANELRSPLAAIRNATALIGHDAELDRRSRELIDRQVNQISALLEDLSDVTAMAEEKVSIRPVPLRLGDVLDYAVDATLALIQARQHQLHVVLPIHDLPVMGDVVRLTQVFSNLLTNAAKYTERGGQIWLSAAIDGDQAEVRVRDSGIGMDPEFLPKAFSLFSQVQSSHDRSLGGLGIGLFLVRKLVELHHGTVSANSDGRGLGSEVIVRLPLLR
jgi:PAS domain S-box-containing protein